MRLIAIIPVACALVAFVLSMLTIFAGSKPNYLEKYDMLTFNTSMIGQDLLNKTSSKADKDDDSPLSIFGSAAGKLGDEIGDKIDDVEADLKNHVAAKINEEMRNFTKEIGIHDWYSIHLLDFCEGYYKNPLVNASDFNEGKNVTKCSNRTSGFTFEPKSVLQSELKNGVTLDQLNFPDEVDDAIKAVRIATKAMFVLYCIGAAFAGLAVITGAVGVISNGRASDACNAIVYFVAFLSLLLASAISSVIIVKAVNAINKYGNGAPINISAYKGTHFLTLTWVATVLMFIGSVLWMVDCFFPHNKLTRRSRASEKQGY